MTSPARASTVLTPCRCGSGAPRRELKDAMGIFCAFVCDRCEAHKRAEFNPAIFDALEYPREEQLEPEWPDPSDDDWDLS